MNSDGKSVEPKIEEIVASIRRFIADSTPSTPNKLSAAYAPPPPKTEARSALDDAYDFPALFQSLYSLAAQLPPQIGASNLNGHRIIADSAPSAPNKLSAAYAPPPLKTEALSDLDNAYDFPELFRSLHSLADQRPPQIGASNLNGHRIIADSAPSAPNRLSAAYAPPPLKTETRSDLDDAYDFPALSRSLHSLADQPPPQVGASNLNGHRIDWQQRPERLGYERREPSFHQPRANPKHGVHAQDPESAAELSSLSSARTADSTGSEEPSQGGSGELPLPNSSPPPPQPSTAADIPRPMVACKDTLVVGPMGQSRGDVQSGIPMDDVPPPRMPGDSFGGPIIPAEFRAPEAEPSAPHTGVPKEPQGRTETASYRAIPEGLIDKTAVELLRPLLKEWLDSNMRSIFERALRVEAENAKNRQQ